MCFLNKIWKLVTRLQDSNKKFNEGGYFCVNLLIRLNDVNMKIGFGITLLFFSFLSNAQTVNGIPLDSIQTPYCQIVGTGKFLSNKLTIELDFGQENKYWSSKDSQLLDEKGKAIVFYSMIDALNFMTEYGYVFVSAYAFSVDTGFGKQTVYHYLMKRNL